MIAKLPAYNPLTLPQRFGLLATPAPHLLYANLNFEKANVTIKAKSLLEIPGWTDEEAIEFLAKHQEEFRRCLSWLAEGSKVNFGLDDDGSDTWDSDLGRLWENLPEVKLLQQHGLDHGKPVLKPFSRDGSSFSGLGLDKNFPADPLDPICWYVLQLLVEDGTVGVLRCKYERCGKFFRVATARRIFCSDICRAKNGAAEKTPEEKNAYMRLYRANPRVKKRSKK